MNSFEGVGNFEVKTVREGVFFEKALCLRHRIFFQREGRDEDKYDKFCEHLIVVDKDTNNVVGTYRLLLRSVADRNEGFYSETEFDIENIKSNCKGELLEIGRACVDRKYRAYQVINIMWKEIISYLERNKISYVFGCPSIDHPTPESVGKIVKFFKDKVFSLPQFQAYPLEGKQYPYEECICSFSDKEIIKLIPALLRGYLKMGALICSEPVWDKIFNTADFFILLDTKKMNISFKRRFYEGIN